MCASACGCCVDVASAFGATTQRDVTLVVLAISSICGFSYVGLGVEL